MAAIESRIVSNHCLVTYSCWFRWTRQHLFFSMDRVKSPVSPSVSSCDWTGRWRDAAAQLPGGELADFFTGLLLRWMTVVGKPHALFHVIMVRRSHLYTIYAWLFVHTIVQWLQTITAPSWRHSFHKARIWLTSCKKAVNVLFNVASNVSIRSTINLKSPSRILLEGISFENVSDQRRHFIKKLVHTQIDTHSWCWP